MMTTTIRKDLKLKRDSVYWYHNEETRNHPPFNSLPDYQESHYTRMLIQDAHDGLMPYIGMTKWPLAARVEPSDPRVEDLVQGAISTRQNRSGQYEVVAKFVQGCSAW